MQIARRQRRENFFRLMSPLPDNNAAFTDSASALLKIGNTDHLLRRAELRAMLKRTLMSDTMRGHVA